MTLITELFTVAALQFLLVIAPGPDFVLICRSSLVYSRRTGIYTAIGLALGILVHVTYSLIGIGLIISKSIILFTTIKLLGAIYLIYIGYKSLRAKSNLELKQVKLKKDISKLAAIRMGFISNVLNPKVTLFFLSLFTQVIHPTTPQIIQIWYGLQMSILTIIWYASVALVMSHPVIKYRLLSFTHYVEKLMGALLIALGLKVAFSTSK